MNKEVHLVPQTYFLVKLPVACRNEIDRLDGSKIPPVKAGKNSSYSEYCPCPADRPQFWMRMAIPSLATATMRGGAAVVYR